VKASLLAAAVFIPALFGQGISGPSVLTNGLGTVGQRSGNDVDLRLFGSVTGIYDTGISPIQVDAAGNQVRPDPAFGVELGYGAYGRHAFRHSFFGINYAGGYRHYSGNSYGGNNQQLSVEYAFQPLRRLVIDATANAGTQIFGTAFGPAYPGSGTPDANLLLFDNRTNYFGATVTGTYLLNRTTSIFASGSANTVHRQSQGLSDSTGYNAAGGIQHQFNRNTFVTLSYTHLHYSFNGVRGESNTNSYTISFMRRFARTWTASVSGGAFQTSVSYLQLVELPPYLAEILGVASLPILVNQQSTVPTIQLFLSKQYRRSNFSASAGRVISPGNGLYLTSKQDNIGAGYSYSGIQRVGLSAAISWNQMNSLGQNLSAFRQLTSSLNVGYFVGHGFNLTATYNYRHQVTGSSTYLTNSSRVVFGIAYSPGNIPISFH
jgi:hypothetical protein